MKNKATEKTGAPSPAPIGREQIRRANETLSRYRRGKADLDRRIVENEQWYRLRHWSRMGDKPREMQPASAWLFNVIASKYADAMENYPAPQIFPREESDVPAAELLTQVIPVLLTLCYFEQVYADVSLYRLKNGTGVYGVFWDPEKAGGAGDVSIRKADLLNLFWEPGVSDIQRSPQLFYTTLADNDRLLREYPFLEGALGGAEAAGPLYDDGVDRTNKSTVVEWYYKKRLPGGGERLHYAKYVNETLLYASENDEALSERGWYDHGEYPFVFDTLYAVEGSPAGFGYIDIGKSAQQYVDRANQAILENLLANARPRHFISMTGSVNEAEYADITQDFVHVDGQLGQDSILPIEGKTLSDVYLRVLDGKIEELKETTGNRDSTTGGAPGGVTAASAIAALQEAGGKLSRNDARSAYRAYRRVITQMIELIRQFYTLPRCLRITGEDGAGAFIRFSNEPLLPREQTRFGVSLGQHTPVFDIEVAASKADPYTRLSRNDLAMRLYQAGFFEPERAGQALACLQMMDFDRKHFVENAIRRNAAGAGGAAPAETGLPLPPRPREPEPLSAAAIGATGAAAAAKAVRGG